MKLLNPRPLVLFLLGALLFIAHSYALPLGGAVGGITNPVGAVSGIANSAGKVAGGLGDGGGLGGLPTTGGDVKEGEEGEEEEDTFGDMGADIAKDVADFKDDIMSDTASAKKDWAKWSSASSAFKMSSIH